MDVPSSLVMQLRSSNSVDKSELTNKLLAEFHHGYDIRNLLPLLASENCELVKAGIWIASELGQLCIPMLSHLTPLLSHPSTYVRYFAIDCMLSCSFGHDGCVLATVVAMFDDIEGAVRRKAMDSVTRANVESLSIGLGYFERMQPNSDHVTGLRGLLGINIGDDSVLLRFLENETPVLRKYGVIGAARMVRLGRSTLKTTAHGRDEDVMEFSKRFLALEFNERSKECHARMR